MPFRGSVIDDQRVVCCQNFKAIFLPQNQLHFSNKSNASSIPFFDNFFFFLKTIQRVRIRRFRNRAACIPQIVCSHGKIGQCT
jgi:hypothetical protein